MFAHLFSGSGGGSARLEQLVEKVDGDARAVNAEHRVVGGRQEAVLENAHSDDLRRSQMQHTARVRPLAVQRRMQGPRERFHTQMSFACGGTEQLVLVE